jgi:hypothetical protein
MAGLEKEAREAAAEVLKINPKFSLDHLEKIHPYKKDLAVREGYFESLRKAGLK